MASASAPPDLASASSFHHFRLHHFHLGLELRPEARELAGCLVLELSALQPEPCALVLDTHPALTVQSVRCRLGPPHSPSFTSETPRPPPHSPSCTSDTPRQLPHSPSFTSRPPPHSPSFTSDTPRPPPHSPSFTSDTQCLPPHSPSFTSDTQCLPHHCPQGTPGWSPDSSSLPSCPQGTPHRSPDSPSFPSYPQGTLHWNPDSPAFPSCPLLPPHPSPDSPSFPSCPQETPHPSPDSPSFPSCPQGTPHPSPDSPSFPSCPQETPHPSPDSPSFPSCPQGTPHPSPDSPSFPPDTPYQPFDSPSFPSCPQNTQLRPPGSPSTPSCSQDALSWPPDCPATFCPQDTPRRPVGSPASISSHDVSCRPADSPAIFCPQDIPGRPPGSPATFCSQDTPHQPLHSPSFRSCPQDAQCQPLANLATFCPQNTSASYKLPGCPSSCSGSSLCKPVDCSIFSNSHDTPCKPPRCFASVASPAPCWPPDSSTCLGPCGSLDTSVSYSSSIQQSSLDTPAQYGPLDPSVSYGLSHSPVPCSPLQSPSPVSPHLPHDILDTPVPWSPPCTPELCVPFGPCDSLGPLISAPCAPLHTSYQFISSTTLSDQSSNSVTLSAPSSSSPLLSVPSPTSTSLSSSIPSSTPSIACTPMFDRLLSQIPSASITNHYSDPILSDASCHFQSIPITSLDNHPLSAPFSMPSDLHNGTVPEPAVSPSCPLVFRVDAFTDYGSALILSLPDHLQPHQPFQVIIRYTTTVGPAVWWLDPELTYGNSKLFVFTQGHSVCNRSFFPCFDTPAVKCTYSATVKAPAGIQVLMSATRSSFQEEEGVYQFFMEHPIPAYLVALVAGDIIPADIGPRSRVWAEPCLLPTATSKLDGLVERWLCAAESLYGPYIWGRYDLVFLPPSFPIVAMENPCLTFIISSILESDEFLIIDVIHEIAHSWFGNAVTNATWEEMWLSEGLATYAQRRITTETYGAAFTCLETAFRLDALHRQTKLLGHDTPVSKLQVKLELGVNPSNLMNLFTYEKGYCFVYYLSQLCGDLNRFDCFLRAYIEKYMFSSVVAQDLLDSFLNFFPELQEKCVAIREGLEFERWLNATGPPLAEPDLSQGSSFTNPVETLCELWTTDPLDASVAVASADITTWRTFQTVLFLDRLLDRSPLPHEVMVQLSKSYSSMLDSMNAEIRIRWLQLVVRNNYYPDLFKVRHFLESQMSRMYTIPLYEDLCASSLNPFAVEVFYQTQNQLHPNLRKTIQQILLQGVNSALCSTDPAMVASTTPAEPTQGAISLRDVNVSA